MPAITATAPGKIILFGEHAVVYQQPAIAVPVQQVRARAIVTPAPEAAANTILIDAPDIGLKSDMKALSSDHPIAQVLQLCLTTIGIQDFPSFTLRVSSSIPLSAGMGSGAAISIATLKAVSAFLGKALDKDTVNQIAFEIEKLYHGTPSGIDNTVINFEKAMLYQQGQGMQSLKIKEPFSLLIADTGQKCSTAVSVAEVRKQWLEDPEKFNTLFEKCGLITAQAVKALSAGKNDLLGPLMTQNHQLLKEMGVSSPELDKLVMTAIQKGAQGAKLSGGGRGGAMIALVQTQHVDSIAAALIEAGAVATIHSLIEACDD